MATITFRARIESELRILVGEQRLNDASNAGDPGTTEDTSRTAGFARNAAAKTESLLGGVGTFDDADNDAGDQEALQWAVRWSWLLYRKSFRMIEDIDAADERRELISELMSLQATRVAEASTPVVSRGDR